MERRCIDLTEFRMCLHRMCVFVRVCEFVNMFVCVCVRRDCEKVCVLVCVWVRACVDEYVTCVYERETVLRCVCW